MKVALCSVFEYLHINMEQPHSVETLPSCLQVELLHWHVQWLLAQEGCMLG